MAHCECGAVMGEACQWSGPARQTVTVEYMPEHLKSSHRAARNWGSYPANGAERIRVHRDCAKLICEDDEYAHIIRVPKKRTAR